MRAVSGRRHAGLGGQRQDRALQIVDLGGPPSLAGPPTWTSAPADRSPACAARPGGTARSGRRRMSGIAPRRHASRCAAGRMPAALSTASASSICAASSRRQRRSASCCASGRPRQRVERIVEIEEQLAPQHAGHVGMLRDAARRHVERLAQAGHAARDQDACRWWRDGSAGAVRLPSRLHDVEGHHARDHALRCAAGVLRSASTVADAVLQADDDGVGRRVAGDQLGHLRRGAALDGDEDDLGLREALEPDRWSAAGPPVPASRSAPSRSEMRRPCWAMASASAGRSSNVTSRPASARQPPT